MKIAARKGKKKQPKKKQAKLELPSVILTMCEKLKWVAGAFCPVSFLGP